MYCMWPANTEVSQGRDTLPVKTDRLVGPSRLVRVFCTILTADVAAHLDRQCVDIVKGKIYQIL
jgi:hypothetical protein